MSQPQSTVTYEGVLELIRQYAEQTAQQLRETAEQTAKQFRETDQRLDRKFQETADQIRATAEQMKATDKKIEATDQAIKATDQAIKATDQAIKATDQAIKVTTEQMRATDKKIGAIDHKVGNMVEKLVGDGSLVDQFRKLGHKVKTHSRKKVFGEKGTTECGEIDLFLEDGDIAILVEAKTTLSMDDVIDHIERLEKYRRFMDADGRDGRRYIGAVAGTVIAEGVIDFAYKKGLYVIIQSARAIEILPPPVGFVAKKW